MKKSLALLTAACLAAGLLSGCGTNYDAAKSTIFILSSGKVILTEVTEFDEGTYDKNELVGFAADNIEYYNEQAGKKAVKLKELHVGENFAMMITEYASVDDYCSFTGNYLVYGTVTDLESQGITFDGDFVSLDRKNNPTACDAEAFLNSDKYKVVIAGGNFDIKVPKSVAFLSATGASIDSRSLVTIDPGFDILNQTEEKAAEDTEEETKNTVTKDSGTVTKDSADGTSQSDQGSGDGTGSASDGSISEDELLAVGEEQEKETEEYDFEADYAANADNFEADDPEAYNNIRVYIIYK